MSPPSAVLVVIGMPVGMIVIVPLIVLFWKLRSRKYSRMLDRLKTDLESRPSRHRNKAQAPNHRLPTLTAERHGLVEDARRARKAAKRAHAEVVRIRAKKESEVKHLATQLAEKQLECEGLVERARKDARRAHAKVDHIRAKKESEVQNLTAQLAEKQRECEAFAARLGEEQRRYAYVKQQYLQLLQRQD